MALVKLGKAIKQQRQRLHIRQNDLAELAFVPSLLLRMGRYP